MKGNAKVIASLNKALHDELTAIVQYMVQAEICENWGYVRLAAATKGSRYDRDASCRASD